MHNQTNLNIVLVGMPGAGKSYIGKKLAKLLAHFNYIDTDYEIEQQEGLKISEIFEKYSEKYFRKLETNLIKDISQNRNYIISVGGGAFENSTNRDLLKENGLIFYLKSSAKELFKRIEHETHRPLLQGENLQEIIEKILIKREKNYFKANFIINTYQKKAYTILNDILSEYENYVK
jgi:shikimate kinase